MRTDFAKHINRHYHCDSKTKMEDFMKMMSDPLLIIQNRLSLKVEKQMVAEKYHKVCTLKSVGIFFKYSPKRQQELEQCIVSVIEREENTSEGECETGSDTVTTDEESGSEEHDYGDTKEERNEVEDVEPEESDSPKGQLKGTRKNAKTAFASSVYEKIKKMAKKANVKLTPVEAALEKIIDKEKEFKKQCSSEDSNKKENAGKDRKNDEEMHQKLLETFAQTKKRKLLNSEENDTETPKVRKNRQSGTDTLAYLNEKSDKEMEVKKEELQIKKKLQ
ncbi:cylicin-1-like [Montipora capricornis]|uniref:cylicin-1-like n=1 Tax=Montipora capricornis TaxID=246305 RepID=UPI0035F10C42